MRIFKPSSAEQLSEWLIENRVDVRGDLLVTGAVPEWRKSGLEPLPRLAISTADLSAVKDLRPTDLTIEVGAGMRVGELSRLVWNEGLWLPCLVGSDDRSVGGLVSEAPPSPFDSGFGPVRRHVLACELVLYDGRITRWGRAVMKNVAGYDVPRLACGSRASLGILTSVTLRLWPRAPGLQWFGLRGPLDKLLAGAGAPRMDGIVARASSGREDLRLEIAQAGGDASTEQRGRELGAWAAREGLSLEELEGLGSHGTDAVVRRRARPRDGAAYRLTFGRRYLADGLETVERCVGQAFGKHRLECFPSTGVVCVDLDGLEPAGRRKAPAWLTTVTEPQVGGERAMEPRSGPALRVERGGPAEHDASRRLRPAATRHFEQRLVAAFGGRQATWQADYL